MCKCACGEKFKLLFSDKCVLDSIEKGRKGRNHDNKNKHIESNRFPKDVCEITSNISPKVSIIQSVELKNSRVGAPNFARNTILIPFSSKL